MKFQMYIAIFSLIAELIPVIKKLVESLDKIDDTPGTGLDKLELVLSVVRTAFDDAQAVGVTWEQFEPYVRTVVESLLKIIRARS